MNWKKRYEEIRVGDRVISIKKRDLAKIGTEGIVRKIYTHNITNHSIGECAVEITKKVGDPSLHRCGNTFRRNIGYHIHLSELKKL